ncbi:MAG: chemotaxis protein CheW [Labilithrix sp.]
MTNLVKSEPTELVKDDSRLFVVFRVDGVDYALNASEVLQMESFTGATTVPGTPPFVRGILQLRGRVVPVVDLRLRFGLPPRESTLDSRVVVAESAGRAVALLADSAREVVRIPTEAEKPPPALASEGGFVRSIVQLPDRTILVLDFGKVIGEETTTNV